MFYRLTFFFRNTLLETAPTSHTDGVMTSDYNPWLVLLSIAIAIVASYTALDLTKRVTTTHKRTPTGWLIGGAMAMGIGIWSMHFVAMLAFCVPVDITYDLPLVVLSMLNAVIASGAALLLLSRSTLNRLQLEAKAQESEQKLRQVIDLVPHLIFAKNKDGQYILANKARAEAYGTSVEELLTRKDEDFAPSAQEAHQYREADLQVINSGQPKHIPEETLTDAQGNVRIFQTTKIPFFVAGSEVPAVLGVSIDITERKQTEQELREGEAAIRTLYKVASARKLNFDQRLQGLLTMGRRQFGLDIGHIGRVQGGSYEVIAAQLPPQSAVKINPGDVFDLEQLFCWKTFSSKEPICFESGRDSEWCNHPAYKKFKIEAYIGARVMVGRQAYGIISFSSLNRRCSAFKASDRQILKLMAQWVGNEIERQQSKTALEQQFSRALLLKQITQEIRQSLNSQEIFQTTANQIGKAFRVNRCVIRTYLAESERSEER